MKRKRVPTSSKVRRQRDPIPWRYCVLTVICGLLLLGGFFLAAKQHFSAVGYAMDNAKLRLRISHLKDERRKLLISKERASSPDTIVELAKDLGFTTERRIVISRPPESDLKPAAKPVKRPVYSYISDTPRRLEVPEAVTKAANPGKKARPERDATTESTDGSGNQIASLVKLKTSKR